MGLGCYHPLNDPGRISTAIRVDDVGAVDNWYSFQPVLVTVLLACLIYKLWIDKNQRTQRTGFWRVFSLQSRFTFCFELASQDLKLTETLKR